MKKYVLMVVEVMDYVNLLLLVNRLDEQLVVHQNVVVNQRLIKILL
jgi:hypothetical protein